MKTTVELIKFFFSICQVIFKQNSVLPPAHILRLLQNISSFDVLSKVSNRVTETERVHLQSGACSRLVNTLNCSHVRV